MNTRITISLSIAATLLVLIWMFSSKEEQLSSTVFCAHNRVFVEFDHNGYLWGTMMLDREGQPIPCTERSKLPVGGRKQQII